MTWPSLGAMTHPSEEQYYQDQVQDYWSQGWGNHICLLFKKKTAETDTFDTGAAVPDASNESIIDPITRVHGNPGEEVVVEVAEAHGSLGKCTGMTCSPCGSLMPLTRKTNGKTLGAIGENTSKWD